MAPHDATPNFGTNRIEALTDGLFAIVMTILVLELGLHARTYALDESFTTIRLLQEMWPDFNNYIMSFLFLGIWWTLHYYQFHYIKRTDGVMIWINILFLMTVALVPFCNTLVTIFGTERILAIFYPGIGATSSLLLYILWWYATRKRRFVDGNIKQRTIDIMKKILLITVITPLIGIVVSFFNLPLSWAILGLSGPFLILLTAIGSNYLESSKRIDRRTLLILILIFFVLSLFIRGYLGQLLNL
ncbi:TMEM175 family protein [[Eubacterium] cellulosolvens]